MRKLFTKGNLINGVIIVALLVIVFVPPAKALLIRGLMGIGLFKADVTQQAPAVPVVVDIAFQNAAGQTIRLSQLKGKVVFLNFWATWCPPCRAEMPSINALHQKLKDDSNLVFIMVDADSQLANAAQFMAKYAYDLPLYQVISDVPQSVYSGSLPTTVIFNKAGELVFKHDGMANYDSGEVEEFLMKLASAK
ncbi:TlpA family protein disulfide reductase [Mucilaginibacter sp. ZT4R22]|uniref:TlpA family protein disulfide reductase n=1 Tax=Mucilaginibacter pankratovii TaxID=2772110 RepID=A0ABR7WUS7_9SPHI|nr:TlpA disulfide reductase family protein [Mucilaginibacter pankratovii]MBD1366060.1 TlpA family protein disulfide reductase [Mucilaginibacter pankratovii]